MSKTKKIILGILTFSPLLFLILYMVAFFSMMSDFTNVDHLERMENPDVVFQRMGPLFAYLGMMMLVSIGLIIYYLLDIFSYNQKFKGPGNSKLVWTLIVLLTGMIGMIVYFFAEIVPRKELPPLPTQDNYVP